jgi:hypothetical protein
MDLGINIADDLEQLKNNLNKFKNSKENNCCEQRISRTNPSYQDPRDRCYIAEPYQLNVKQRSCADVNSPYTVKKISDIPVPSRDFTYHTLPFRE